MNLPPILNPYVVAFFHPSGNTAIHEDRNFVNPVRSAASITVAYEVYPFLLDTVEPLNCACSTIIFALNIVHARLKVQTMVVELVDLDAKHPFVCPVRHTAMFKSRRFEIFLSSWIRTLQPRLLVPGQSRRIQLNVYKIEGAIPAVISTRLYWTEMDLRPSQFKWRRMVARKLEHMETRVHQQRIDVLRKYQSFWPVSALL